MTVPHITDAEEAILEALWRCGPLMPARLIAEVKVGRDWGDATIKTLIARLMHKAAIKSLRHDGALKYYPQIDQAAYAESEIRHLIRRLFNDDIEAFTTFVGEHVK